MRNIAVNFDTTKPLFNIHQKWPGVDAPVFMHHYEQTTGQRTFQVKPSELHLEADANAHAGYRLLYRPSDGDEPQREIEQCSIELFQEEFEAFDPILLRKLSTCCLNDLRSIFIIHDKRILGVIFDELTAMIERGVFTKQEGMQLRNGIAETLLPGTLALKLADAIGI